jgi:uncharacterized protein YlxP (DUF503 family)
MVVSMIQLIIEIPEASSIKDKRRVVKSLRDRLHHRFKLSAAEVDLQDSLRFSQIGGAYVSNSRQFGESIMQKVLRFVEDEVPGRIQDVQITSEIF